MIEIPEPLVPPSSAVITITCDRDRWTFARQYQTMIQLCWPTDWIIVINERKPQKWLQWYRDCLEPMGQGRLRIQIKEPSDLPYQKRIQQFPDYWTQQFYKLLIARDLDRDFIVILDSKNWLIKPWHPIMHRVPERQPIESDWNHFYKTMGFAKKFQIKNGDQSRGILPPIAWETGRVRSLMDKFNDFEKFLFAVEKFFQFNNSGSWKKRKLEITNCDVFSEFMLYDFYDCDQPLLPQQSRSHHNQNCCIPWNFDDFNWPLLDSKLSEVGYYWFTVKWHLYQRPTDLPDKIWARVFEEIKLYA